MATVNNDVNISSSHSVIIFGAGFVGLECKRRLERIELVKVVRYAA